MPVTVKLFSTVEYFRPGVAGPWHGAHALRTVRSPQHPPSASCLLQTGDMLRRRLLETSRPSMSCGCRKALRALGRNGAETDCVFDAGGNQYQHMVALLHFTNK
jgi:hypothetical protein